MKSLIQHSKYFIFIPHAISAVLVMLLSFLYITDYLGEGLLIDGCLGPYRDNSFSNILIKLSIITGGLSLLLVSCLVGFRLVNTNFSNHVFNLAKSFKVIGFILLLFSLISFVSMSFRYDSLNSYTGYLLWSSTSYGENEVASSPVRFFIQSIMILLTYTVIKNKCSGDVLKTKRAVILVLFLQIFLMLSSVIFIVRATNLMYDDFFFTKGFNSRFIRAVLSTYFNLEFSYFLILITALFVKLRRNPRVSS